MQLSYKYQTIKYWTVLECFDRYYIGIGQRTSSYFCLARNSYTSIIYIVDSQWNARPEWNWQGVGSCLSTETLRWSVSVDRQVTCV